MPRYFFDVVNGNGLEADEVGSEHASLDVVRKYVSRVIADIARDEIPATHPVNIVVNARDEQGNQVVSGKLQFGID